MSFNRILVPLDGSRLAEAGLPTAKALARRLSSVLVLVHVVEEDPPGEVHGERHLASKEAAEAYLEQQKELCDQEGLSSEVHVVTPEGEDIAEVIIELAGRFRTELVAMCAHGRQTLKGRFVGPIAQRALRAGGPPIMLRTAGGAIQAPVEIRHILLPVDFRHELQTALDDLRVLAKAFDASVTLLHAFDAGSTGLPARMLPNTRLELSARGQESAEEELGQLVEQLRGNGVRADGVVSTKSPEDAIIEEARARKTDMILLVSHGRSGISAWFEGSVGSRVIQEPELNLLLVKDPV